MGGRQSSLKFGRGRSSTVVHLGPLAQHRRPWERRERFSSVRSDIAVGDAELRQPYCSQPGGPLEQLLRSARLEKCPRDLAAGRGVFFGASRASTQ
jgi:hypothetical protein